MSIERITDLRQVPDESLQWLGESFYGEGKLPGKFVLENFKASWGKLIAADIGALWVLQREGALVGAIGGVIYPDINDGQPVAMETFWYVAEAHRGGMGGIRLMRDFELWAGMKGAKRIIMAYIFSSMPESVKHFYERDGYRPMEMWYVKET